MTTVPRNAGRVGDERQEQEKKSSKRHEKKGRDCSLFYIDGLASPQELGVGAAPPNNKGRVGLQVFALKDDSGCYVVVTEHGSSASQVSATKVPGVIARLLGYAGQASDSVSACRSQNGTCPTLLLLPKDECPDIWIRLPPYKWPRDGRTLKNQCCPCKGICTDILLQGCHVKASSRRFYCKMVRSKHQLGNVCSSIANKDCVFKMAGKEAKFCLSG